MKTLVAGAVAVLSFAALTLSFAPPAAADDATPTPPVPSSAPTTPPPPAEVLTPTAPEITAQCSGISAIVYDLYPTAGHLGVGWGPADKGEPPITQIVGPYEADITVMFEPNNLYVSTAMNWRVVVWRSDGTIAWDKRGTTTPCPAPVLPKHAQPVKPPAPPCGSTLDDVAWPSTPGIAYSHDYWNGYARLLPGYEWANSDFNAITGWWLQGGTVSSQTTLVWLPRQLILNPTGKCGANKTPPANSRVDSPCWYGLAHPQPCPTPSPVVYVPTKPMKLSAPPTTTTFPVPPADATTPAQPSPVPTPNVAATTRPTGSPSPAPSPSATPTVQATPRVGTSTGLGVAGGLAGACVLAAAGAFVVRRRLRSAPNVAVMEEPE